MRTQTVYIPEVTVFHDLKCLQHSSLQI